MVLFEYASEVVGAYMELSGYVGCADWLTILGGTTLIEAAGLCLCGSDWSGQLYRSDATTTTPVRFKFIPYASWANRGEGEMITWVRESF